MAQAAFVLAPCLPEDVEQMASNYLSAFKDDYFNTVCFPGSSIPGDERRRWLHKRFLRTMTRPEVRNFKVTEVSTGKLTAFARWHYPYQFNEEEKAERERERQQKEKERADGTLQEWPLGSNMEVCDLKFGKLDRFMEKYVDPKDMYGECVHQSLEVIGSLILEKYYLYYPQTQPTKGRGWPACF
jgi:hypothetical protein